ncbi:unnamed protein product [Pleuronectes platessa]|uniref:Uncharacterized protein n=1 Tax=Pleuronectes platessa TaxID=8262 RepID=A0A9N7YRJ8_PLEPL|nr:unnamed protein product [Pleuronectes platessa]
MPTNYTRKTTWGQTPLAEMESAAAEQCQCSDSHNASCCSSSVFTSTSDPDNDYRTQEVGPSIQEIGQILRIIGARLRRFNLTRLPRGGDFIAQIQHRGIMPASGRLPPQLREQRFKKTVRVHLMAVSYIPRPRERQSCTSSE